MDLSSYSKILKILAIVPVLVGALTFLEMALSNLSIEEVVVSKRDTFRIKTASTTYTVDFQYINDQFTEDIYYALKVGHPVTLEVTPFHKQIMSITLADGKVLINETGEELVILGFGLAFLLCSLAWFRTGNLRKKESLALVFIILISIISGIRMLL